MLNCSRVPSLLVNSYVKYTSAEDRSEQEGGLSGRARGVDDADDVNGLEAGRVVGLALIPSVKMSCMILWGKSGNV